VKRELTILVPAFNESRRIGSTLECLLAWGQEHLEDFEVLVVDDGSDDGTAEAIRSRFGERVRVVQHPSRSGKGAAIRTGVREARKPWVLFADADLSIPIEEFEKLWARAHESEIVIGSKRAPGGELRYPPLRKFLGGIGQSLIALFVVSGFHDTQCGFKLYRTDVARELTASQRINGFGFDFELLFLAKRLGWKTSEVAVRCGHVGGGTVRLSSYFRVLGEIAHLLSNRLRGLYPRRRR
jgi:dolichyl-phosphate beta-glucosyltransferase